MPLLPNSDDEPRKNLIGKNALLENKWNQIDWFQKSTFSKNLAMNTSLFGENCWLSADFKPHYSENPSLAAQNTHQRKSIGLFASLWSEITIFNQEKKCLKLIKNSIFWVSTDRNSLISIPIYFCVKISSGSENTSF